MRSDTGIKIEGRKIWVECKRVTTEHALERNLRKACSQLQDTFNAEIGSGHRGIIAMDVSKIPNPKGELLVAKDDTEGGFKSEVQHLPTGKVHRCTTAPRSTSNSNLKTV